MAAFFLHIPGRRDFQPNIDGRPADVSKRSTAVFVVFFFWKNHVIFPTQKDDRSFFGEDFPKRKRWEFPT